MADTVRVTAHDFFCLMVDNNKCHSFSIPGFFCGTKWEKYVCCYCFDRLRVVLREAYSPALQSEDNTLYSITSLAASIL